MPPPIGRADATQVFPDAPRSRRASPPPWAVFPQFHARKIAKRSNVCAHRAPCLDASALDANTSLDPPLAGGHLQ